MAHNITYGGHWVMLWVCGHIIGWDFWAHLDLGLGCSLGLKVGWWPPLLLWDFGGGGVWAPHLGGCPLGSSWALPPY